MSRQFLSQGVSTTLNEGDRLQQSASGGPQKVKSDGKFSEALKVITIR